MIEYCRNRLFPDGFPTKSMLPVTRDDFVTAREVMAMSVVQGGPSPNFLACEIYRVVSRSFAIEEVKDESLKETCVKVQMIYLFPGNTRDFIFVAWAEFFKAQLVVFLG